MEVDNEKKDEIWKVKKSVDNDMVIIERIANEKARKKNTIERVSNRFYGIAGNNGDSRPRVGRVLKQTKGRV